MENNIGNSTIVASEKRNRIQVSNTKRPFFFYLNLAKRYLKQHNEVELSALGTAIPTAVIIAEILKRNGVATNQKVMISTVTNKDQNLGRVTRKAKIELVLRGQGSQVTETTAEKKGVKFNADMYYDIGNINHWYSMICMYFDGSKTLMKK